MLHPVEGAYVVYAADVVTYARACGWFDGKDAEFSFCDTYAPLTFSGIRGCDARVFAMFNRVNPLMRKYEKYALGDATAERLLKKIYSCDMRCLLNDINYSRTRTYYNSTDRLRYGRDYYERVNVNATATFYETMVGGTADAGLPASERAAS